MSVKIDWLSKLRLFLQTMAFCLAISAIQYAFQPGRPYEVPLIYSICFGTGCWAVVDFGRHLFASSAETGWPQGMARLLLPVVGTVCGYFLGTLAGDWWFGWSSWDVSSRAQLPVSILITALAGLTGSYYFYSRTRHGYLETGCRRRAATPPKPSSNCWKHSWSHTCCSTRWPTCAC
jgi:hypothetical protein